METDNLVTGPEGTEVPEGTLGAGQVPQGGTLPTGTSEAEKAILLKQIQDQTRDINQMKSAFQKSEAQLRKDIEKQRIEYENSIREIRLSKMDEEERKKFEAQELEQKNRNYEEEARLAKQALIERDQKDQYRDFFISKGIPVDKLVNDKGLQELVASGYEAWDKITSELRAKIAELEKSKGSGEEDEITPPEVDTVKAKPASKATWAELIKRWGSEENVWRGIESGVISPEILPKN